jgi:hypothetical protein
MFRSLLLVALAGLTFSACDTTDPVDPPNLDVQTATNVYAPVAAAPPGPPVPPSGPFKLYSLRTNSVVANADSASTSWDLGFRNTDIIVNGGTSGPGQGQAVVISAAFADVTAVPTGTVFRTDGDAAATCSNNVLRAICGGSAPANTQGWYTYTGAPPNGTNLILPTAGRTILVRTADGAGYAKVQIRSYYQNAPATPVAGTDAPRYYTFDFVLNPAGTSFVPAQ